MKNQQNKPRLKINVVDIIIIAAVVIAAGVLLFVWRSSGQSSAAADTRPVRYTIELSSMTASTAETIKEGDTILDSTKKFVMGTVQSVTLGPTTTPEKNLQTGDTVQSEIPGKVTATIELICNASETEAALTADSGYLIRVGSEVTAAGPGYAGKGYVVAIVREDGQQ